MKKRSTLPLFLELLQDRNENSEVRWEVAFALYNLADSRALGPLIRAGEDPDIPFSLTEFPDNDLVYCRYYNSSILLQDLKGENEALRLSAALHLGIKGDDRALNALLDYLHDTNGYTRGLAVMCLKNIGSEKAIDALFYRFLIEEEELVQRSIIGAFGNIGGLKAKETLIKFMEHDKSKPLQENIRYVLKYLHNKKD